MPTEFEVWNLFWLATLANGVWFAGLAFLLWVSLELLIWLVNQITFLAKS